MKPREILLRFLILLAVAEFILTERRQSLEPTLKPLYSLAEGKCSQREQRCSSYRNRNREQSYVNINDGQEGRASSRTRFQRNADRSSREVSDARYGDFYKINQASSTTNNKARLVKTNQELPLQRSQRRLRSRNFFENQNRVERINQRRHESSRLREDSTINQRNFRRVTNNRFDRVTENVRNGRNNVFVSTDRLRQAGEFFYRDSSVFENNNRNLRLGHNLRKVTPNREYALSVIREPLERRYGRGMKGRYRSSSDSELRNSMSAREVTLAKTLTVRQMHIKEERVSTSPQPRGEYVLRMKLSRNLRARNNNPTNNCLRKMKSFSRDLNARMHNIRSTRALEASNFDHSSSLYASKNNREPNIVRTDVAKTNRDTSLKMPKPQEFRKENMNYRASDFRRSLPSDSKHIRDFKSSDTDVSAISFAYHTSRKEKSRTQGNIRKFVEYRDNNNKKDNTAVNSAYLTSEKETSRIQRSIRKRLETRDHNGRKDDTAINSAYLTSEKGTIRSQRSIRKHVEFRDRNDREGITSRNFGLFEHKAKVSDRRNARDNSRSRRLENITFLRSRHLHVYFRTNARSKNIPKKFSTRNRSLFSFKDIGLIRNKYERRSIEYDIPIYKKTFLSRKQNFFNNSIFSNEFGNYRRKELPSDRTPIMISVDRSDVIKLLNSKDFTKYASLKVTANELMSQIRKNQPLTPLRMYFRNTERLTRSKKFLCSRQDENSRMSDRNLWANQNQAKKIQKGVENRYSRRQFVRSSEISINSHVFSFDSQPARTIVLSSLHLSKNEARRMIQLSNAYSHRKSEIYSHHEEEKSVTESHTLCKKQNPHVQRITRKEIRGKSRKSNLSVIFPYLSSRESFKTPKQKIRSTEAVVRARRDHSKLSAELRDSSRIVVASLPKQVPEDKQISPESKDVEKESGGIVPYITNKETYSIFQELLKGYSISFSSMALNLVLGLAVFTVATEGTSKEMRIRDRLNTILPFISAETL